MRRCNAITTPKIKIYSKRMRDDGFNMKRRSVELVLFVLAHDSGIENRVRIRAFEELIL